MNVVRLCCVWLAFVVCVCCKSAVCTVLFHVFGACVRSVSSLCAFVVCLLCVSVRCV